MASWKLFLTFFILFGPLTLKAEISDPNHYLDRVDQILGRHSFAVAFKNGDEGQFEFSDCSKTECDRIGGRVRVEESGGKFWIKMTNSSGKVISQEEITPAIWNEHHQNFVRIKLKFIESFGFRLEAAGFESVAADSFLLSLKAENNLKQKVEYSFLIQGTEIGIGQILKYTQVDHFFMERTVTQTIQSVQRPKVVHTH